MVRTRTAGAAAIRAREPRPRAISAVSRDPRRHTRAPAVGPSATVGQVMDVEVHLSPDAEAPSRARDATGDLEGVVSDALLEDLRLVVSELVSNAVVHGPRRQPVELRLTAAGDGRVRGEVVDHGDSGVVEIRRSAGEGGGWGLRLLAGVPARGGVYEGPTHVWSELSEPEDRGPDR